MEQIQEILQCIIMNEHKKINVGYKPVLLDLKYLVLLSVVWIYIPLRAWLLLLKEKGNKSEDNQNKYVIINDRIIKTVVYNRGFL